MGEETKAPKRQWFKGLKNEFKKITWPDKMSVVKQTAAVTIISIVVGVLIKVFDMLLQFVLNFIM